MKQMCLQSSSGTYQSQYAMAAPWCRLNKSSGDSALKSFRVEKRSSDMSPVAQEVPAWCWSYQLMLDIAKEQLTHITEAGKP
jgi:hypothetical protein